VSPFVDWLRRVLGLAPIHRHEYIRQQKWCYIGGNLCMQRKDVCACGHVKDVHLCLIADAEALAEADLCRMTSAGTKQ
jgi:hypothetical protein